MVNKSFEFLGIEKEHDKNYNLWGSLGCRLDHKHLFGSPCINIIIIEHRSLILKNNKDYVKFKYFQTIVFIDHVSGLFTENDVYKYLTARIYVKAVFGSHMYIY